MLDLTTPFTSVLSARARSVRLFAYDVDQPRSRRATDAILAVSSILGLALLTAVESPPPTIARALADLVGALPPLLDSVWEVAVDLLAAMALAALVATLVRRRWSLARDLVLAAAVSAALALVLARLLDGSWPDTWLGLRDPSTSMYAHLRLAVPASVLVTLSPHVILPLRRVGRWLVAATVLALVALGSASVVGALAGFLVAVAAASVVHLALGSSAGRPSANEVRTALAELGIAAHSLSEVRNQPAGVLVLDVDGSTRLDPDPSPMLVKVYGRDAHGSAVLSALWRTAWMREPGRRTGFGRLRQVEHEALMTLLARQAGVATDEVVTAGMSSVDDALLVLRRIATEVDHDPVDLATRMWHGVELLHAAGLSHGQIDVDRVFLADGRAGLSDFRAATATPQRFQLLSDRVQMLASTISLVGLEPAVRIARNAIGDDALVELLPLLQPSVLTPGQRRQMKDHDLDLDDLRRSVADRLGVEVPDTTKLHRFSIGSLLRIALPVVALFGITAALSGFDYAALGEELSEATWWLVVVGFVLAQTPRIAQAVSTLGASPVPLPLGPVYALQLAVSYVNIAIPSSAARMAVNIRFFQRHGVPPGGAIASGALDGFSGLVTQMILLTGILLLTPLSLDLDLELSSTGSATRLLVVVSLAAAGLVLVGLSVARLRTFVVRWTRQLVTDGLAAVRGLRSFRRAAMLFGGNMASDVLFALTLGTFARAFGHGVGLGELVLITIAVSLLAGLLPIPGGIGVTEGGLIYGLIAAGVPEEVAFATVILHRVATFYLPPVWGFFAFRWLERNRYL